VIFPDIVQREGNTPEGIRRCAAAQHSEHAAGARRTTPDRGLEDVVQL
jgi:hypothetical protein